MLNTLEYWNENVKRVQWAKKFSSVTAEKAQLGEIIKTVVGDHLETQNIALAGDMLVTNLQGEKYLVSQAVFWEKYELAPESERGGAGDGSCIYIPKGKLVEVIELIKDVEFTAPWGEIQRIRKGGYLIKDVKNPIIDKIADYDVNNPSEERASPDVNNFEIYGIDEKAFRETYAFCPTH